MATNKTTDAKHGTTTGDNSVNDFSKLPLLLGHDGKYDKPKAKTAFQKRSQPYNPAMINQFKLGIMTRDVEAVAEAIEHGVNPATMIGQTHPLMALMYDQTEGPVSQMTNMSFPRGMSSSEYFQETSKIVDLLLESGVKLLDNDSYRTKDCKYLVDHLLYSPHHDDLSNIVIHAIKEGLERNGRPYERDLVDYVGKYVENQKSQGNTDEVASISIALRQFATVHEIVSNRIAEPSTAIEWDLSVRSANDHGTWGETLNLPSVRNFQQAEPSKTPTPAQVASKVKEIEKNQGGAAPAASAKIDDDIAPFITVLQKRDPADVLADIMKMTGNEKYKEGVEAELLDRAFVAIRASHGLKDENKSLHMALTGATGTGKTSLARLDAEYLYAIGFGGPNFAEVSRTKLMKGHIGATDVLMNKLIATAHFIFIDEAPQLVQASQGRDDKQDFGHRVVEAVIPATENNRSWQVFYFAGYTKEMDAFLNADKGFRGRISRHVHLDDPSKENLGQALDGLLKDRDLKIDDEAKSYLLDKAMEEKVKLGDYFANYRAVRTIAENLRPIMARRLLGANKEQILGGGIMQGAMITTSIEDCMKVTMEDVKNLDFAEIMGSNSKKKAEAAANQNNNGSAEYQGTTIGFTGTLKKLATPS